MWKFKLPKGKDRWLFLLSAGVILCILAFPMGERKTEVQKVQMEPARLPLETASDKEAAERAEQTEWKEQEEGMSGSYEARLERRVKEILKEVEGVGAVDVMIVLKSSGEKVIQVDDKKENSVTEEQDTSGGTRKIQSQEAEQTTVLVTGGSGSLESHGALGGTAPIVKKELYPELSGIVITADGGANPAVQAEISAAMEALFGLPAHKIKVLKRAK